LKLCNSIDVIVRIARGPPKEQRRRRQQQMIDPQVEGPISGLPGQPAEPLRTTMLGDLGIEEVVASWEVYWEVATVLEIGFVERDLLLVVLPIPKKMGHGQTNSWKFLVKQWRCSRNAKGRIRHISLCSRSSRRESETTTGTKTTPQL
jgi:hypothetical protein